MNSRAPSLALAVCLTLALAAPVSPTQAGVCDFFDLALTHVQLKRYRSIGQYLSEWLKNPLEYPQADGWAKQLLRLSDTNRAKILEHLKTHPLPDRWDERVLKLLLYDRETWIDYWSGARELEDPAQFGINGYYLTALDEAVLRMPRELFENLRARLPENYERSKRPIDAFFRARLRPENSIKLAIDRGATPLQAYSEFLRQMGAIYQAVDRGGYEVADVLSIAHALQKTLRRLPKETLPDGSVSIFGSVPSGRAELGLSDVDINSPSKRQAFALRAHIGELNSAVRDAHEQRGHPRSTRVSIGSTDITPDLSPVQIEVSPEAVALVLYGMPHKNYAEAPPILGKYYLPSADRDRP